MKVAVTVWEDRVSPVFDSARNLLIAEIENARIIDTSYQQFNPEMVSQLASMLRTEGVDVIICGAISEGPATLLEAAGFDLISFIAGDVDKVFKNFIQEDPVWTELIMPGCRRNICCRGRIRERLAMKSIVREERAIEGCELKMSGRIDSCCGDKSNDHRDIKSRGRFGR